MPEGAYIPKFKVGQTVMWKSVVPDDEGEAGSYGPSRCGDLIIFATFRSLENFSRPPSSPCPTAYDESEPTKVMYAAWSVDRRDYFWIYEHQAELYCSNANRGKRTLLEANALAYIAIWFDFTPEGRTLFQKILETQPLEDS